MDRYVAAVTWLRALKIYWAQMWRAFLIALALSCALVLGFWLHGPLLRMMPRAALVLLLIALGVGFALWAGAWSMKRALQVRYADFTIDVTPVDGAATAASPTTATLTEWHALAIFWAMAWRGWLLAFPLNLLAVYLIQGMPSPTGTIDWSRYVLQLTVQMAISVATGTWALRIALKLDYGNWRLQLIPVGFAPLKL